MREINILYIPDRLVVIVLETSLVPNANETLQRLSIVY